LIQDQIPRLLLVEDDPDAACLMQETLHDHFGADCTRHCSTVTQALLVDLTTIDLVLSDMNLPDGTGMELLEQQLQQRPDLPVVLVTAENVMENAITAIKHGAYDYVVKAGDYLFALPIVVEKNLALWHTKQENQRLGAELQRTLDQVQVKNQQLEQAITKLELMAATDPLTCLANRRCFGQTLESRFADALRHDHDIVCLMIDLDGFKQLNDSLGHQQGDRMLQLAARVLNANCRRSDVAGRFGGDEFIVVLPQTDENTASQVAMRIRDDFHGAAEAELSSKTFTGKLTMSMGLATMVGSKAATPEQLIGRADHALYRAKQAGKTRLMVYKPAANPQENATVTEIG
jgi:diguanylate cyclase (GGDEF)-like protein